MTEQSTAASAADTVSRTLDDLMLYFNTGAPHGATTPTTTIYAHGATRQ